ncbi:zinc finger MYM-type protein 1-like [Macrosteles quadrilineatus]|uniref:zinc finger MYM-type protein 1-like n=1 Tax=Macrosteles quadrilineatus TaxID=74068 RepID=UPI0023E15214|nr:zinc finger MYM-type protein 1-like [Macrosteles quadrilineatus]
MDGGISLSSTANVTNEVSLIINEGIKNIDHRISLKKLGPPRPFMNINQIQNSSKNKNSFTRKFSPHMYNHADWLCGCSIKNSFFCYTCLVMGVQDRAWTVDGISDLKHLLEKVKKHKTSEKHINASIEYAVLGKVDIRCQLDNAYRLKIQKQNEDVSKNRYILSKLIDAIKFCGAFELALRGHDERENSKNPGIFRGLVNLMAELDVTLQQHINQTNNRVFLGLSKTIQNELLDSIYYVCLQMIRDELTQTDYVAIEADETTDCATLSQLVFVIRYELNGTIHERFITFIRPKGHDAESVSETIFEVLEQLNLDKTPDKVIAQSYDGASVMSGQHTGVQARVKSKYKNANFVHCYAHQLNLIIERSATQNKQVKIFFSNIEGFSSFFSQSTKRTAVLDEIVKRRIPKSSGTRWNFKSRIVSTIFNYQRELEECLSYILDDDTNDYATINKAVGLRSILKDEDFIFWLDFFNQILPHSDILYNQLQQTTIDCVKAFKFVGDFKTVVDRVRNSTMLDKPRDSEPESSKKRRRHDDQKRVVAKEVCDIITSGIDDRFTFVNHLSAAKLFQPSLFGEFKTKFPEKELHAAAELFSLNKTELKQELNVIYNRDDFSTATGSLRLLNFVYDNNLKDVLPESIKLLKIISTIPMTTSESERCFSTLKRIKTFTRSTMKQDRLSALAMCSIEKKLLSTLNFNEKVIDHFAGQKERRMDFTFKQYN